MPRPGIIHTYYSVDRREIDVQVFGSGGRTVLVMAGVHGDEADGVEVVRALRNIVCDLPGAALGGARLVLMPLANPDGAAAETRQNARGIDINRNFPERDFGTGEKSGQYYGGEVAASEPETRAIMSVVNEYQPELTISLHSPLGCVNYNGPSEEIAQRISELTGLPTMGDIGYPCPGSMGNYYGRERQIPLITLELPRDPIDPEQYARVILRVLGLSTPG